MSQSLRDPNFEELPVGGPTRDQEEISINAIDPREQAIAEMEEIHRKLAEEKATAPVEELREQVQSLKEDWNLAMNVSYEEQRTANRRFDLIANLISAGNIGTAKEVVEYAEELWTWIVQK